MLGLRNVTVACLRAKQNNPVEHSHKSVRDRTEHEDVKRSHAALEQREVHLHRNISECQKCPCRQTGNKHSYWFAPESQDRNRHDQDDSCASCEIADSREGFEFSHTMSDVQA